MSILRGLIYLALLFGVINLALWGGQELYYREDTNKIRAIEAQLETEKQSITTLESKIISVESELKQRISQLDRYKTLGLIAEYNRGVDSFNSLLSVYRSDINAYDTRVANYKAMVDEANALIKKSGSRWYLIPIPLPSKSIKSLPIK